MNSEVTAKNMQVTAAAEAGIVIAAYTNGNATAPAADAFSSEDDANITAGTNLIPTFTTNATAWYHAASLQSNNGQAYTAAGYDDVTSDTSNTYYLMNKFQIKSPGGTQAVYVKSINITLGATQDYDPSLRVLIKSGDATLIFAPVGTHTGTEGILSTTADDDDVTTDLSFTFTQVNTTGAKILNDVAATAEDVTIYLYYDGEDVACKSDNIPASFLPTKLDVVFTSTAPSADTQAVYGTIANDATFTTSGASPVSYYAVGTTGYYVAATTASEGDAVYVLSRIGGAYTAATEATGYEYGGATAPTP